MTCIQGQLGDLASIDAEELGEVVDMVKDCSEAIYYEEITKAMQEKDYRDMDRDYGRMYYDDRREPDSDFYSGRSSITRKMYMEHKDKATQVRELEDYMKELSHDVLEMIDDSTTEEKQMLKAKLTALATKIV